MSHLGPSARVRQQNRSDSKLLSREAESANIDTGNILNSRTLLAIFRSESACLPLLLAVKLGMSGNAASSSKRAPLAAISYLWQLLMSWFQALVARIGGKQSSEAGAPGTLVSLKDGPQLVSGRSGSAGDGSYTMEDLPPEVLARVLALVPARQLARCAAVCRLWRQLAAADSLWERHWERDEKGYEAGPFAEKYLREGRRAL
jgi:hypothetical protein